MVIPIAPVTRSRDSVCSHEKREIRVKSEIMIKQYTPIRVVGLVTTMAQVLSFSGHQYLRQRLVLSILSGKSVRIDKIRPEHKNPGLTGQSTSRIPIERVHEYMYTDYEVSLLRLLEKVTNGTVIEISLTGML